MSQQTTLFPGARQKPLREVAPDMVEGIANITLWPYQAQLMKTVRESMQAGHRRVVLQGVTGMGKREWLLP